MWTSNPVANERGTAQFAEPRSDLPLLKISYEQNPRMVWCGLRLLCSTVDCRVFAMTESSRCPAPSRGRRTPSPAPCSSRRPDRKGVIAEIPDRTFAQREVQWSEPGLNQPGGLRICTTRRGLHLGLALHAHAERIARASLAGGMHGHQCTRPAIGETRRAACVGNARAHELKQLLEDEQVRLQAAISSGSVTRSGRQEHR